MKDTLLYIVQSIVDHPDDVVIDEQVNAGRTVFAIHANPEDIGKIIGKKGRIISAIRDLVKIIATKQNLYVDVTIAEDMPVETQEA